MGRLKVEDTPLSRQLICDLAETSQGLSEPGSGSFAVLSTGSDLAKGEIDSPNGLHGSRLVRLPEDGSEVIPTLPIIDDSIYHDLSEGDGRGEMDGQRARLPTNSQDGIDRRLRILAGPKKLEFDLDPR